MALSNGLPTPRSVLLDGTGAAIPQPPRPAVCAAGGREDGRWRDLAGIVRESDVTHDGACHIEADMKGLPVGPELAVRVVSSSGDELREGTARVAWQVPPPAIVWTSPGRNEDVVNGSGLRLAVSAYAPGEDCCLDGAGVEWFVDGEQVATGSLAHVRLEPGEHQLRVRCQDSGGRISESTRSVTVRSIAPVRKD